MWSNDDRVVTSTPIYRSEQVPFRASCPNPPQAPTTCETMDASLSGDAP